ncbi:cell surface glycoprotein 1 [Ceratobasidium sp. AG-Ba]|nr:cell surface glycoprotein 1 [Ceratobasidium sp. AG-Ba]
MSIGPRRSIFARLNIAPQAAASSTEESVTSAAEPALDAPAISSADDTSVPNLVTIPTANSSTLDSVTPPPRLEGGPAFGSSTSVLGNPNFQSTPPPASGSAMDVDGPDSPDLLEMPRPRSHIPETYRNLPSDHYLVAPPAALPYPRSPPLRIDESHPLYTPASLFAHLPRAPPLSPRLDPLDVLILETTREQSEWEQVRKDLGRPVPSSPKAESQVKRARSTSRPSMVIETNISQQPSGSLMNRPVDLDSDTDSSDVELHVYDHVSPISRPTVQAKSDINRTKSRASSRPAPSLTTAQPSTSIATSAPPRVSEPQGLFNIVPHRTQSAFSSSGAGPSSTTKPPFSPESTRSTPAKRKYSTVDDNSQTVDQTSAPEQPRTGVPPPLRASVDRATAPIASTTVNVNASNGSILPGTTVSQLQITVPTTSQLTSSPIQTPSPATDAQTGRKPCRFYNRPPGRVCVRKEECPDLHEGPLQKPLSATSLAASTASGFSIGFGGNGSEGNTGSTTPAPAATPTPNTLPNTSTVSRPPPAPAPTEQPAPNNSVSQPPARGPSQVPSASAPPASAPNRVAPSGLPPRPLSSVDKPATPPCRFFNTAKGCNRGTECPFRHERTAAAKSTRATRAAESGANGTVPTPAPAPLASTNVPKPNPPSSIAGVQQPANPTNAVANEDIAKTASTAKQQKIPEAAAVKIEQESPGPKTLKQVIKTRAPLPPVVSRQVKEEEVTIRDLADDDVEMAGGAPNTSVEYGPILPPELVSGSGVSQTEAAVATAPQPLGQAAKNPAPKEVPAAPANFTSELPPAPASAPTSAPVTAAPAPVLSTVVIPPTPVHPAPNKDIAPRPAVAPHRPPSRDSRMLDTRDRRELLNRIQDPPIKHTGRGGHPLRVRHRHHAQEVDPQFIAVIHPVPEVAHFLGPAPGPALGHILPEDTTMDLARMLEIEHTRPGGQLLLAMVPAILDHIGALALTLGARVQSATLGTAALYRHLEAEGYCIEEIIHHAITDDRSREGPPALDSRLAVANSAATSAYNYNNRAPYYPPEAGVSRSSGASGHRSPVPPSGNPYADEHAPYGAQATEPIYQSYSNGYPQNPRGPDPPLGFSNEPFHATSIPSQPSAMNSNPSFGLSNKPILISANHGNFEQSMEMGTPSPPPEVHNPGPTRLQDRVDQYPGFVPATEVTSTLYARMTGDREQPRLAERLASSETYPQGRGSYNVGQRSTSGGNAYLAARLGVNSGERSQSLVNRIQDEHRPKPGYQNRDRESTTRPGGGLMARMIGDKKPA